MSVTNIDDLLLGGNNSQPNTAEENERNHDNQDADDFNDSINKDYAEVEPEQQDEDESSNENESEAIKKDNEIDDYGNEQPIENETIRERLKQQAKKYENEINDLRQQLSQQKASPDIQQAVSDFEYDADASGDWQQQLASFVKQTVNHMHSEKETQSRQQQERQDYQTFESKFRVGMDKFPDFVDVVNKHPIDDAMTQALRGISDPASFIYAAAKRQPQELKRISEIRDPFSRIVEMGKLEERMKKNKTQTSTPRPLNRTSDNGSIDIKNKENKNPSIEDLIEQSNKERLANLGGRPRKR